MKKRFSLGFSICLILWISPGAVQTGANSASLCSGPDREPVGSWSSAKAGDILSQEKRARAKRIDERPRRDEMYDLAATRKTWARTYGDVHYDSARAVQITGDGGFIVAGSSRNPTDLSIQEALILKLSANGEIEWQYAYSGVEEASSIRQTPDGGFIVCGTTKLTDADDGDFWLLKLDPAGTAEWQRVYGDEDYEHANSVWATADGGCVVAGSKESLSSGRKDGWVLKLTNSGEVEWQSRYGGADNEAIECVRQTEDGGYIAAGHILRLRLGLSDFLVVKLTPAGSVEWQKTYGEDWNDEARNILQTSDGGYLVTGEASRMTTVVKLSPLGDILWHCVFWNATGQAGAAKQTIDGGSIIVGTVSNVSLGGDNIFAIKLSATGDLEWQKTYAGMWHEAQGVDVDQYADGGYVIAGHTSSYGAGDSDILILRLDPEGQVERFPEISRISYFSNAYHAVEVRDITPRSRQTNVLAIPADIPHYAAAKKTWLIFSPPYLSGKRVLNRSLSQAEYIDALTWEPNPNNSDLNIVFYRLYLDDGSYGEQRLADISPNERTFLVKDVAVDAWHTYSLFGITDKGEEGMRRFFTIKERGWQ